MKPLDVRKMLVYVLIKVKTLQNWLSHIPIAKPRLKAGPWAGEKVPKFQLYWQI